MLVDLVFVPTLRVYLDKAWERRRVERGFRSSGIGIDARATCATQLKRLRAVLVEGEWVWDVWVR